MDMADKSKVSESKSDCNETNLTNLFTSKKSTKAGYLTSKSAKKGSSNTKKNVKAAKSSDYLTSDIKKACNFLRHVFTQALMF